MDDQILTALNTIGIKRRGVLNDAPMRMKLSDLAFFNISFALAGEDVVLAKALQEKLRHREPGFYVDAGCFDPRLGSNTYLFNCYGWRGVCIDANPRFADDYKLIRPNDVFVHGAVGTPPLALFFAEHRENTGMSKVQAASDFGPDFLPSIPVPTLALRDILERHVPAGVPIDFMSVDLEGGEMAALQSNDWAKFPCGLILIETHGIDRTRPTAYPTVAYLMEQGYAFETFVGANVLMKRRA
jgi:hypothetical protein